MAQQPEPRFIDGEQVTTFIENIDQLTELLTETIADTHLPVTELLTDEQELSIRAEAGHSNSYFPAEYATDGFLQLKDTYFYRNIELLTDWARTTHIERSVIDGSLTTGTDGTDSGLLTVTFYPTESQLAAYYLRIKFSDDSTPIVTLFVQPTYYREEDSDERHWRVTDFDATEATEFLEDKRPYCGSRVAELIETLGCNESQAKAQALREAGLPHEEIADRLNITTNASTSYTSKLSMDTETAFKRSLTVGDHPKRFLASQEFPTQARGHAQTKYVLKSIGNDTAYLITRDEYSNTHPDKSVHGTVNISTETYDTVTSLISENQVVDHPEKISVWTNIIQDIDQEWLSQEKEILIDELTVADADNIM